MVSEIIYFSMFTGVGISIVVILLGLARLLTTKKPKSFPAFLLENFSSIGSTIFFVVPGRTVLLTTITGYLRPSFNHLRCRNDLYVSLGGRL